MSDNAPSSSGSLLSKWVSTIFMGGIVAYAAHPLLTTLLITLPDLNEWFDHAFMPILLGALLSIFLIASWRLLGLPDVARRIEHGCRWGGMLLLAAIPVMLGIVFLEVQAEGSQDQGGATAAFFVLMIFGGACAIFGGIMLLVAHLMRRKRQEALR